MFSYFPANPFKNCRLPPEAVLFFCSKWNAEISLPFVKFSSFHTLISQKQSQEIKLQMVSTIPFGWLADFGKSLTIDSAVIQPVHSDKW